MLSAIILFLGMFWESAMDKIAVAHHFEHSIWKQLADYMDRKGATRWGNQFWDNRIAWTNKWRKGDPAQGERFWGSSHIFVFLMDGWHTVKFIWILHLIVAILVYQPLCPFWYADAAILFFIYGLGHHLSFLYLQNRNPWQDIRLLPFNIVFRNRYVGAQISQRYQQLIQATRSDTYGNKDTREDEI